MTMQLVLAWIGGITVAMFGLTILGFVCGEFGRRNRLLRDVTTELVTGPRAVRPPARFSIPAAKGFTAEYVRDYDPALDFPVEFVLPQPRRRMN